MRIKEMSLDERPREKLVAKGPASLSDAELLAIILRTGTGEKNALDLAREILQKADCSLTALSSMSRDRLLEVNGVGQEKCSTIMAVLELGRRFTAERVKVENVSITGPKMIFDMMLPLMKGLDHEECWLIYLNRANYVLCREMLTKGGLSSTVIDIKVILRKVLEKKASGLILVHNHPSGNPHPGSNDILETRKLNQALQTLEISLLDHVVIADQSYYSFSEHAGELEA